MLGDGLLQLHMVYHRNLSLDHKLQREDEVSCSALSLPSIVPPGIYQRGHLETSF